MAKERYAVKKLAKMAGVSVRTLHHYDQIGLLKPSIRTDAGYRLYGEAELLRLQQILFYRELDFELKAIRDILDSPDFNLITALEGHKQMLLSRKMRIDTLIATLDKTMFHLKSKEKMSYDYLYEGLPKEQAEAWRKEAKERWPEQVAHGERKLMEMGKVEFEALQRGFMAVFEGLAAKTHLDPASDEVQADIDKHYAYILQFWGNPTDTCRAYKGLGDLYATDERYTQVSGKANRDFGTFLQRAIYHYADKKGL